MKLPAIFSLRFYLSCCLACCLSSLPAASFAQGEVEDPLAPDKPTNALMGRLTVEELTGTASLDKGSHTLKITVVNNGKRALLLDGDNINFSSGSQTQGALRSEQIISPPTKNTLPGDTLEVGTSIGSGGVFPVAVDAVNKARNPGPAFYGRDEKRRDLAEIRFGKRLVFPGETSSGEVYLSEGVSEQAQLSVPVFSHPDGTDLGKLSLSVSVTTAQPVTKPPRAERKKETEAQRLPSELEKSLERKASKERKSK